MTQIPTTVEDLNLFVEKNMLILGKSAFSIKDAKELRNKIEELIPEMEEFDNLEKLNALRQERQRLDDEFLAIYTMLPPSGTKDSLWQEINTFDILKDENYDLKYENENLRKTIQSTKSLLSTVEDENEILRANLNGAKESIYKLEQEVSDLNAEIGDLVMEFKGK